MMKQLHSESNRRPNSVRRVSRCPYWHTLLTLLPHLDRSLSITLLERSMPARASPSRRTFARDRTLASKPRRSLEAMASTASFLR